MSNIPIHTKTGDRHITGLPDKCPYCHKSITPNPLYGHKHKDNFDVFFFCPNDQCKRSFIGYYDWGPVASVSNYLHKTSFGSLTERDFSNTIKGISVQFEIIYNQAYSAEQQNLIEICGVGYRKALEFLIKDYAIQNHPDDKEKIEKQFLSATIERYVTDSRVKSVAKRAVWLGNDETHYIRKWEGKNLEDLKKLTDLTIHWIEMEALTKSFNEDMPD
ncbi:hypothetical protein A8C56_20795 [Niabella ginsenosidivorans]|uniref:DUF4145 domain-containing protein n=1 Tax=Niabella ginsenosidivorans TaxID=1176587 RepID=A0A1A9I694_9BACT|nr:DUF4145 domain-containing protein [Niabella ginsenosidivorans]ANH83093.1 hypothetical protein A8C56_20795 [Niabella ginsenosidivorans]